MAAITKPTRDEAQIASQAITSDTDTYGAAFGITKNTTEILAKLDVTARTDGTFTPRIEGSIDGTDFVTLATGTATSTVTHNHVEFAVAVDGALPPIIRIAILSASTTSGATMSMTVLTN
jgi:hypothetical protein